MSHPKPGFHLIIITQKQLGPPPKVRAVTLPHPHGQPVPPSSECEHNSTHRLAHPSHSSCCTSAQNFLLSVSRKMPSSILPWASLDEMVNWKSVLLVALIHHWHEASRDALWADPVPQLLTDVRVSSQVPTPWRSSLHTTEYSPVSH